MQLMHFPLVAAFLVGGAASLAMASSLIISAMIGKVNQKLPDDEQVSYLWGYLGKISGIKEQYKRFDPTGSLDRMLDLIWVLIVIMMLAATFVVARSTGNL